MNFEVNNLDNGIKQVKLSGRLDVQGANAIGDRFTFATTASKANILVDLSEVEYLASIGMRVLLSAAKAQAMRGGKMVLCQPSPLVKDALQVAGFFALIPIYDDCDQAYSELAATAVS